MPWLINIYDFFLLNSFFFLPHTTFYMCVAPKKKNFASRNRKRCFTTQYFKGCIEALQLQDEIDAIKGFVKMLNGAETNNLSSNWERGEWETVERVWDPSELVSAYSSAVYCCLCMVYGVCEYMLLLEHAKGAGESQRNRYFMVFLLSSVASTTATFFHTYSSLPQKKYEKNQAKPSFNQPIPICTSLEHYSVWWFKFRA
jgi:hypothetical protein